MIKDGNREVEQEIHEELNKELLGNCTICGKEGRFRYAPCDPNPHTKGVTRDCWPPEKERWRCTEHQPYESTFEGWNGEWDDYFPEEPCK